MKIDSLAKLFIFVYENVYIFYTITKCYSIIKRFNKFLRGFLKKCIYLINLKYEYLFYCRFTFIEQIFFNLKFKINVSNYKILI